MDSSGMIFCLYIRFSSSMTRMVAASLASDGPDDIIKETPFEMTQVNYVVLYNSQEGRGRYNPSEKMFSSRSGG
jgi:hypothetical protein